MSKMKDVVADALDMSKEEFTALYGNNLDYDEIRRDYGDDEVA